MKYEMQWLDPCLCSQRENKTNSNSNNNNQQQNLATIYPCNLRTPLPQVLFTYYALVSLIVVILSLTLIWIPFVQLIAEFNTVVSRVLIYTNKELLGDTNLCGLKQLGEFLGCQEGLIVISIIFTAYLLYVGAADFLIFVNCYIYNLPDVKYLQTVKRWILGLIGFLLSLTKHNELILGKDDISENWHHDGEHHNHVI